MKAVVEGVVTDLLDEFGSTQPEQMALVIESSLQAQAANTAAKAARDMVWCNAPRCPIVLCNDNGSTFADTAFRSEGSHYFRRVFCLENLQTAQVEILLFQSYSLWRGIALQVVRNKVEIVIFKRFFR